MKYKSVERFITVEFVGMESAGEFEIRVTPELLVARCGDTVVWDVQLDPPSLATKVVLGDFLPVEVHLAVVEVSGTLVPIAPRLVRDVDVPVAKLDSRYRARLTLRDADPGTYKYSIKSQGGHLLRDPEIEIKGPRGG